jgi:hypothetical protein
MAAIHTIHTRYATGRMKKGKDEEKEEEEKE